MSMINLLERLVPDFVSKYPKLWVAIATFVAAIPIIWWPIEHFRINPLQDSVNQLNQQLIPFKTVALQKFAETGESQALNLLAERIGQVEFQVANIFDYKEASTWDFFGIVRSGVGTGIKMSSPGPISGWSNNFIIIDTNRNIVDFDCSQKAIDHYTSLTIAYSYFPFPYYFLAECDKKKGDDNWKEHMTRAYEIISVTTRIVGHHEDHDWLLKKISHVN